jgi:dGTP triphosphohydrolase
MNDFGAIVAASLAHDIGNPPFGHSGEKAIGNISIGTEKIQRSTYCKRVARFNFLRVMQWFYCFDG